MGDELNPPTPRKGGIDVAVAIPADARPAVFAARPNRFLVLARLDGRMVKAHLADPGRLEELLAPGVQILLSPNARGLKTDFTVHLVRHAARWVSINSRYPNLLVAEGLERHALGALPPFSGYSREVRFGGGRIDFMLDGDHGRFWLEVKGCSLVRNGVGLFPDAPTARGRRHLEHLIEMRRRGEGAGVVFVVGRDDAVELRPNAETDPAFAVLLGRARAEGVLLTAFRCRVSPRELRLDREIPVTLA